MNSRTLQNNNTEIYMSINWWVKYFGRVWQILIMLICPTKKCQFWVILNMADFGKFVKSPRGEGYKKNSKMAIRYRDGLRRCALEVPAMVGWGGGAREKKRFF